MRRAKDDAVLLLLVLLCSGGMGVISTAFLKSLSLVSSFRDRHPICLALLPLVGTATTFVYHRFGKGSHRGNNLIIESAEGEERVPLRMGILAFFFTVLTHLCGGSAGREGTAVQMGGTLTNKAADFFCLDGPDRRVLILSGVSAGFGSVFGAPLAGAFFGLEFCHVGKLNYRALLPCCLASFTADLAARSLGASHTEHVIQNVPPLGWRVLLTVLLAACTFGLIGRLFSVAVRAVKGFYAGRFHSYLVAALMSSLVVLAVMLAVRGVPYDGLSTWMIDAAFRGKAQLKDPFIKFLLTCLTLGAGFQGGEVTPLFDIGASAGAVIGQALCISPSLLAALGLISVFGCAANTPVTTLMLGIDLFGSEGALYFVIAAVVSYHVSGHRGIYAAQRIETAKARHLDHHIGLRLEEIFPRPKKGQGQRE